MIARYWDDDSSSYITVDVPWDGRDFDQLRRTLYGASAMDESLTFHRQHGSPLTDGAPARGSFLTGREMGVTWSKGPQRHCACGMVMGRSSKRCAACHKAARLSMSNAPVEECFCGRRLTADERRRGCIRCAICRVAGRKGRAA